MLNRSCPPWALGKLNSGASAPTSGTASFCLRRMNSIRPSFGVPRTYPEYYRLSESLAYHLCTGKTTPITSETSLIRHREPGIHRS
jgi:hypothetical protein